ncbi:MAG: hypothetical protein HC884_09700 [Chloroflexaceae bacterium]|nr:hypothetical protein [Chloroflexaceae bacterium]
MRIGYGVSSVGYAASYVVYHEGSNTLLPPTNLTATPSGKTVNLTWQDNSTTETGFLVERSDGGNWQPVGSTAANATSYTDNDATLQAGTTYYYRVAASQNGDQSAFSSVASVTIVEATPDPPNNLQANASGNTVVLTWNDQSDNETGFEIARWKEETDDWSIVGTVAADVTSYTDSGVAYQTTYYYKVRARNASGPSAYTDAASAKTGANQEAHTAPWNDGMEAGTNGWGASGLWHQVEDGSTSYANSKSGSHSWWYGQDASGTYDTGQGTAGALTSPRIAIPDDDDMDNPQVRFWSWYETEASTKYDQRRVLIAVDNGDFQDLKQLSGDAMNQWTEHIINLESYQGKTVQFQFVFDSIDGSKNDYRGWYVDDVSVAAAPAQVKPSISSISPDQAPPGGGTQVVITGSNFAEGATVTLGSTSCTSVTVSSSTQIQCLIPPHQVGPVDVTVTNPDGQSDTLEDGFIYGCEGTCIFLHHIHAEPGSTISVPLEGSSLENLIAADITITFDPTVVEALEPEKGSLLTEWTLVHHVAEDELRLAMANPGDAVNGDGSMVILKFNVIGSDGTSSALHFDRVDFNGLNFPGEKYDGSITVGAPRCGPFQAP